MRSSAQMDRCFDPPQQRTAARLISWLTMRESACQAKFLKTSRKITRLTYSNLALITKSYSRRLATTASVFRVERNYS